MIRALLVLACVAVFGLCLLAMRRGWVHRVARQDDVPELPAVPARLGAALLTPISGLYVGSTVADEWQNRIAARGLGVRAEAMAALHPEGLLVERAGTTPLFLPAAAITGAGVGAGLAGKVLGPGGLLIVRWEHGGRLLDTGLRADDKSVYPAWVQAIDDLKVTS